MKQPDGELRHVPEFLVFFDIFERIAKEYDLNLVKRMNFHEYYAQAT